MGKKTRKTRWRTLSLSDPQSDNESHNGIETTRTSWRSSSKGSGDVGAGAGTRYQNGRNRSQFNSNSLRKSQQQQQQQQQQNGVNGKYWYNDKSTSRSNSTNSDNKITFNEDEYTRITTPRQDVLFKKGYLNKPKPYLKYEQPQQSLTSTGNSTGDGTPDHHSAGEYGDYEYEQSPSPFLYPTTPNGFIDPNTGTYFINGFDPSYQPIFIYNPAAVCYPPPPPPSLPDAYLTTRTKRYSTDSNEFPEEGAVKEEKTSSDETGRKAAKKKRRRIKAKQSSSGNDEHSSEEELSEENEEENDKPMKYRVDAEEFVPRSYRPPAVVPNFVPIYSPFVPPGVPIGFVQSSPVPVPPLEYFQDDEYQCDDDEEVEEEEEFIVENEMDHVLTPPETTETKCVQTNNANNSIDIAKIVSKLEQAALEQRQQEERKLKSLKEETKVEVASVPFSAIVEKIPERKVESSPKIKPTKTIPVLKTVKPKQQREPVPSNRRFSDSETSHPTKITTNKTTTTTVDQWISVSNKKKRKGKPQVQIQNDEKEPERIESQMEALKLEEPVKEVEEEQKPIPIQIETETTNEPVPVIETDEKVTVNEPIKKNKKRKKKRSTAIQTTTTNDNSTELDHTDSKTNLEVSLEMDQMIQRGLYANLEEKLKTYNPSDKFIRSGIVVPRLDNGYTRFNNVLFNNNKALIQTVCPPTPIVVVDESELDLDSEEKFPITRAVKEWMVRTREKTPEVEMFRKPDQLSRKFLNFPNGDENECEVSTTTPEFENPEPVRDENGVEEEEALEVYESVYGSNADYEQIKRDVSECSSSRRNFGRDGGLPYRAICCTIM